MLPWFMREVSTMQNSVDFESSKKILIRDYQKMVENRCFEKIDDMIESKSSIKNEDIPEKRSFCLRIQIL